MLASRMNWERIRMRTLPCWPDPPISQVFAATIRETQSRFSGVTQSIICSTDSLINGSRMANPNTLVFIFSESAEKQSGGAINVTKEKFMINLALSARPDLACHETSAISSRIAAVLAGASVFHCHSAFPATLPSPSPLCIHEQRSSRLQCCTSALTETRTDSSSKNRTAPRPTSPPKMNLAYTYLAVDLRSVALCQSHASSAVIHQRLRHVAAPCPVGVQQPRTWQLCMHPCRPARHCNVSARMLIWGLELSL